ncbi:MAG: hypothetical protein JWM76_1708 [Pseudonocardiales bacterium]|nr:hypothetical protein [Pseudonocardiales bacterium]
MARYLVTGASRGIGRCLVELLAPEHDLIALGRSSESVASLPVAETVIADLDRPDGLAALIPVFDSLDGVVHCAGMARRGLLEESRVTDWDAHLRLNVTAAAELTRLLLPGLRAAQGSVVFINSGQGRQASANSTVYAASKFALRGMADALRAEEPELRVTTIYPGRVATEMQQALRAQEQAAYEPEHYLQPETVARAIAFVLAMPRDAVVTELVLQPARP